jgi:hypothetical protein
MRSTLNGNTPQLVAIALRVDVNLPGCEAIQRIDAGRFDLGMVQRGMGDAYGWTRMAGSVAALRTMSLLNS